MAHGYDTMMNPSIEDLLEKTGSKFRLVSLSAMRSREITSYLGQLSQGVGAAVRGGEGPEARAESVVARLGSLVVRLQVV